MSFLCVCAEKDPEEPTANKDAGVLTAAIPIATALFGVVGVGGITALGMIIVVRYKKKVGLATCT